ncbi:MAG: hypothetical protein ABFD77_02045 [Thermotogota bacterium]
MGILSRGRLINKFIAVIRRLDTAATAAVVGGGFDKEFDAVRPLSDGTQFGADSRREMAELRLPVQLDRNTWGRNQPGRGGRQILADIVLTFHWPDLENAGLIGTDGEPVLKIGDRIDKIETVAGATEATFKNPPGMFFTGFERAGHGQSPFGTPRTNLLFAYCAYARVASEEALG